MGLQDRDYYRYQSSSNVRGGFLVGLTPVVKWLLILNVGVFVMEYLCTDVFKLPLFQTTKVLCFSSDGTPEWRETCSEFTKIFALYVPYLKEHYIFSQYVTYQFLHADFKHLLFNMLALFMFGRYVERQIGSLPFLKLYLLGGIFAGICHLLFVNAYDIPVIGASGAIYGILAAFAVMNPNTKLMVFLGFIPVIMKARTMVLLYAVLSFFLAVKGGGNVAHLAHLGGILFGFIYAKNFLWLRKIIGYAPGDIPRDSSFSTFKERAKVYRGETYEEASYRPSEKKESATGDPKLDDILERMRVYGMHTLSDEDWRYIQKKREER